MLVNLKKALDIPVNTFEQIHSGKYVPQQNIFHGKRQDISRTATCNKR